MVSEPFLWLFGSCGHLRRSSATFAFIQSSLSEASHRRHAHSTCNTRISMFCAFNCQRKGIERQNSQSRAKPNQEWPENCITRASTRRLKFLPHEHTLHAPSVPATRLTRPHAPIHAHSRATRACYASLLAMSALGDVTLPRQHTSFVDRWPLTLTIVKIFQQDLFCSVFRVDSDFELSFCIWGL